VRKYLQLYPYHSFFFLTRAILTLADWLFSQN